MFEKIVKRIKNEKKGNTSPTKRTPNRPVFAGVVPVQGGLVNSSRVGVIERSYCALIVRQQAALYED